MGFKILIVLKIKFEPKLLNSHLPFQISHLPKRTSNQVIEPFSRVCPILRPPHTIHTTPMCYTYFIQPSPMFQNIDTPSQILIHLTHTYPIRYTYSPSKRPSKTRKSLRRQIYPTSIKAPHRAI